MNLKSALEIVEKNNLSGALVEYHHLVKYIAEEYTDELNIQTLRSDHPELNFFDDEEIDEILKLASYMRNNWDLDNSMISASEMGKKGGSAKSKAKINASKENGKKGGRPTLKNKIEELESQGWKYETNYNTGTHILSEALVKTWVDNEIGGHKTLIKSIEKGKISDYSK